MKVYKWILCIVVIAALGFCFVRFGSFDSDEAQLQEPTAEPQPSEPTTEFDFSAEAFNTRLLTALNEYRTRNNLEPWRLDEALTAAAKTRAQECSVLGTKSHTRSDGSPWFTVLGITENFNYSEITGLSGHSPDDLLRKWVSSESINSSLLDPAYSACGVECEAIGSEVFCVMILFKP